MFWKRCYPAKPKLKLGTALPENPPTGTTGEDLLSEIRKFLSYGFDYDYLLIVDDEDCRFHGKSMEEVLQWQERLKNDLRRIMQDDTKPVYILFASPEIESWFVADWENGLGGQYPKIQHPLNRRVKEILGDFYQNPEGFGEGFTGKSCLVKLSEQLVEAVRICGVHGEEMKKGDDTILMLRRIDPAKLAARCTRFFAPVYQELRELG